MFEDLQSVVDSNFNASLKTKVLVHGYTGNGDQSWVIRMKAGFLEKGKATKMVTKAASKYLLKSLSTTSNMDCQLLRQIISVMKT